MKHKSVLLEETIETLNLQEDSIVVDCTLGYGGHSSEILKRIKRGYLFAFDQDQEAIDASSVRLSEIGNNFTIIKSNFVYLKEKLKREGVEQVDAILFDLGVSSPQLDEKERGFSYHQEDNQITWQETDGILTTDTLKDTVIKPGESKEIDIVFRWNGGDTNLGEKQNTVILSKTSNPAGYEDNNNQDDTSKSEMLITVATGLDSNDRAIMIAALQILILVAIGLMFGRKKK